MWIMTIMGDEKWKLTDHCRARFASLTVALCHLIFRPFCCVYSALFCTLLANGRAKNEQNDQCMTREKEREREREQVCKRRMVELGNECITRALYLYQ